MIHWSLKGGWESVGEINRLIPTYGSIEGDWKWRRERKDMQNKVPCPSVHSLPITEKHGMENFPFKWDDI